MISLLLYLANPAGTTNVGISLLLVAVMLLVVGGYLFARGAVWMRRDRRAAA